MGVEDKLKRILGKDYSRFERSLSSKESFMRFVVWWVIRQRGAIKVRTILANNKRLKRLWRREIEIAEVKLDND